MRSTVAISRSTSCTWLSNRLSTSRLTDTEHHETVALTSMLTSSGCFSASSSSSPKPIALQRRSCPLRRSCSACAITAWLSGCGADMADLRSGAVAGSAGARAGFQIQKPTRQAQQPEQFDQPGIAQARVGAAAIQQGRQIIGEPGAIESGCGTCGAQRLQQRQHRPRKRRHRARSWRRHAGEADAGVARLDLFGHAGFLGDLARELRDVHAQPIRYVQARLDVPDVRDGVEPARLDGNRAQRVSLEVGQLVAHLVGDHALDGLQAFGGRRRRHDVALQALVVLLVLLRAFGANGQCCLASTCRHGRTRLRRLH
mmetsp:Transcript_108863/g.302669  ORF Transcript_108863/g.302669 Transcript_108863/m.302669 type:complete len:314 (+) Transcript_108863:390-1331(+)